MVKQSSLRGSTGMSAPFLYTSLPDFFPTKAPLSDRSSLALVPLHLSGSNWCITPDRAVQLDGAHGSEIVRSICFPNHVSIFSHIIHALPFQPYYRSETPQKRLFDPPFLPLTSIPVSDRPQPDKGIGKDGLH